MNRLQYVKSIERDLAAARQDGSAEALVRVADLERELSRFQPTPGKATIEKATA